MSDTFLIPGMSRNKQALSRGQLTCERSRYRFPLQLCKSCASGKMQCGKISRKKHGVAKSSLFSARGAICCHALSLFFQRAKSAALMV